MSRRKHRSLSASKSAPLSREKVRPPLGVVLGSPAEVVQRWSRPCRRRGRPASRWTSTRRARLRDELAERAGGETSSRLPDLWDLPADFQTALYLPARGGERELKIDMIEQAFHVLRAARRPPRLVALRDRRVLRRPCSRRSSARSTRRRTRPAATFTRAVVPAARANGRGGGTR